MSVSTHSHPKVAAGANSSIFFKFFGFNTQPPEGGCLQNLIRFQWRQSFNTQPPEGGCGLIYGYYAGGKCVSTHSHPKVAACILPLNPLGS